MESVRDVTKTIEAFGCSNEQSTSSPRLMSYSPTPPPLPPLSSQPSPGYAPQASPLLTVPASLKGSNYFDLEDDVLADISYLLDNEVAVIDQDVMRDENFSTMPVLILAKTSNGIRTCNGLNGNASPPDHKQNDSTDSTENTGKYTPNSGRKGSNNRNGDGGYNKQNPRNPNQNISLPRYTIYQ